MGREPMTRKLFKSFASTLHQTTVNTVGYRKKVVLIMVSFLHNNLNKLKYQLQATVYTFFFSV